MGAEPAAIIAIMDINASLLLLWSSEQKSKTTAILQLFASHLHGKNSKEFFYV
jgi:hypothetical protein